MTQHIVLHLSLKGQPLSIKLAPDLSGIIIHGEVDSSPRRFHLEFDSRSRVTQERMRAIQRRQGWHPWQFKLDVTGEEGNLEIWSYRDRLPPGHYWIKPKIEDLILNGGKRIKVKVEEDRVTHIDVVTEEDPRYIIRTQRLNSWDAELRRVIRSPTAQIDGQSLHSWLDSAKPRESRKACLLNILAGLRHHSANHLLNHRASLLHHMLDPFIISTDRVYFNTTKNLHTILTDLSKGPTRSKSFYHEGRPRSSIHQDLLTRAAERFNVDPTSYDLESFRSETCPSLQIVLATPMAHHIGSNIPPPQLHFAEVDMDLGNPLQNLSGFVVHLGEILRTGRTDHLTMRDRL